MNYPKSIPWHFEPTFNSMKEAKELADTYKTKAIKMRKNYYKVVYNSTISNIQTTGRKFYVIDDNGNLNREIITLIKSFPFDGTYKIENFKGVYISRSNRYCDIYISTIFDNHPDIKELIKELSIKGKRDQLEHEINCRSSR